MELCQHLELGTKSLKISQNVTNPTRSGAMQKLTNLTPGTVYTLSSYVKATDTSGGNGACLYVAFFDSNGNGAGPVAESKGISKSTGNEWQRLSVTFTVPTNATRVEVYGGLSYANGTAWFDCLQLEIGSAANTYNMLENGDFNYYNESYQPTSWGTTNFASGDGVSNGWLQINGGTAIAKNIYQDVSINKPASQVTFSVSGESEADSVPLGDSSTSGRYYAIDLGLFYSDGTHEWQYINFNPDTSGIQYNSGPISASSQHQGKTITKVTYDIIYYNNSNTALFKRLTLNFDLSKTTNEYNSNGNLTKTTQVNQGSATYTYQNNEVTTAIQPDDTGGVYTYGGNGHPDAPPKPRWAASTRMMTMGMSQIRKPEPSAAEHWPAGLSLKPLKPMIRPETMWLPARTSAEKQPHIT
ncbi:carbohydrate binding domain-containing protein [Caproicibacter sp. BJN0012]|uniref:carbohydrate binding domain-containing protein n=1 Tax=Acutalibacteraceae TaxID=3082771 RepID=UPI002E10F03C|nr:carbohydrate binding domain-containing protein [Caproicibacter sp. BJN0012]